MHDFDFTRPQPPLRPPAPSSSAPFKAAASPFYKPAIAEQLFRATGKEERFAAGQVLFAEDEKASKGGFFSRRPASRMYFVVSGEVALTARGAPLDTMAAGDIFGEMAVISDRPRTATATAKGDGVAYSLDAAQLQRALAATPEFALMLMSVMFDRLRFLAARLAMRKRAGETQAPDSPVFDPALLARFEGALPRAEVVRHGAGAAIMREGQSGAFMYLVKEGRVAISIRDTVVEHVNAGGTFGEMALVDQAARTASATAESECVLLSVDRPALLAAVRADPAFAMAMLAAVTERLRFMNSRFAGSP
jgi:CRP/FNR family cyclic AMP-dependent transcriptional regulator